MRVGVVRIDIEIDYVRITAAPRGMCGPAFLKPDPVACHAEGRGFELRRSRQTSMKSMFYVRYGGRAGIRGTNDLKANAAQAPWHLNSPERPDTGWTNNNVVIGRQAAGCSAGNRRARSRDWLASQDRAGDARRRLDRKWRMTMARRMRKVVPARGGNRARYEAGRQAK